MVPRARARLRAYVTKLAQENSSPARLVAACVVGGMLGATPFFGLHFFLCVGVAMALRLNKVVVYAAANISIPPLAPFLAAACIEVGTWLQTGHAVVVDTDAMRHASPWKLGADIFTAWLLGAPIVGGAIGAVLGALVYSVARARAGGATLAPVPVAIDAPGLSHADRDFARAQANVRARFSAAPPWVRHYVTWKMKLDPAYRIVADGLPGGGHVVELGAGLGLLPMLLVLTDKAREVTAIDWDATKVKLGQAAAAGLPCALDVADMRTFAPPPCDAIVLLDVLHYFDEAMQRSILAGAVNALRDGGLVFVREADRASQSGSFTRALEQLAIRFGWNRGARPPAFRPLDALRADLEALGVTTRQTQASSKIHPGNAMLSGVKQRVPEATT